MRQRLSRTMAISSVLAGPQTPGASSSCFIRDMVSSKVSRVRANEGRAAGLLKRTCPGSPSLPAPWPPLVHPCGFHAACCADKQQVIPEQNEMKHHQNQKNCPAEWKRHWGSRIGGLLGSSEELCCSLVVGPRLTPEGIGLSCADEEQDIA